MKPFVLSALAAALLSADPGELESLKAQMAQMQLMMQAMQQKIDALETTAAKPAQAAAAPRPETAPAARPASLLDFSVIVDASYVARSKKDEETMHLEVPGIAHGLIGSHSHDGHAHATYNASNGFNLNYAELSVHSTVDPYLDADAVFHFSEEGVEIEEAYFTSRSLPLGLRARGGKFLSDFGRLNNRHHHAWSFSDMPLVYEAFLGSHGINEIGAQLQWTAPTPFYLMAGLEALQGKNEAMFGQAALSDPNDEETVLAGSASQPSLLVAYVKSAFDIGDTSLLAGFSYAGGTSRIDHFDDEDPHAFAGESDLYGIDLTLKHYFNSYSSLTWQSEWLYRDMDGTQFRNVDTDGDDVPDTVVSGRLRKKQSGYYTQLVYAPDQNWGIGARYDAICRNSLSNPAAFAPENLDQISAMVEYRASEFARYRLQYTHSNALFNEEEQRQNLDSVIFSVNLAIGKHGAHSF